MVNCGVYVWMCVVCAQCVYTSGCECMHMYTEPSLWYPTNTPWPSVNPWLLIPIHISGSGLISIGLSGLIFPAQMWIPIALSRNTLGLFRKEKGWVGSISYFLERMDKIHSRFRNTYFLEIPKYLFPGHVIQFRGCSLPHPHTGVPSHPLFYVKTFSGVVDSVPTLRITLQAVWALNSLAGPALSMSVQNPLATFLQPLCLHPLEYWKLSLGFWRKNSRLENSSFAFVEL